MSLKKVIFRIKDFRYCLNKAETAINNDWANGLINNIQLLKLEMADRKSPTYGFCDDIANNSFRSPEEFIHFKRRRL